MCALSSALTKRTTRLYIVAGSEKNIMLEVTKTEEAAQVEPVDSQMKAEGGDSPQAHDVGIGGDSPKSHDDVISYYYYY